MKALRCTMYEADKLDKPFTVVIRDCDLQVSMDEAVEDLEQSQPHTFLVSDVFEVEDKATIEEATIAGMKRLEDSARALDERNMAVSFFWNSEHLKLVRDGGTLANPSPAPLSFGHLMEVIRQLKRLPHYKNQHFFMVDRHGALVTG